MKVDAEVLIVGGGAAGLSAAMSLGRMSRTVLLCDDGRPRNAPAEHMNNFPSHDGLNPGEWRKQVRRELTKYKTVNFFDGGVEEIEKLPGHFRAKLSSGAVQTFKRVILAYGVVDRLPEIPGLKELWGKAVYHCPYCHGYEVRGERLAVVANGMFADHILAMIYSLSQDLVLFTRGKAELSEKIRKAVTERKIRVVETAIESLDRDGDKLRAILLADGEKVERDGIFWAPTLPFQSKSNLGEKLGCQKTEMGFYQIDAMGKTTVEGVFAAGDISTRMHSVLGAAAAGQMAGAGAASELLAEAFIGG